MIIIKNYRDDIFYGIIAIIILWIFFFRIPLFILIILSVIAICMKFSLGRDESTYWENQSHNNIEQDRTTEQEFIQERPAYSLRVDESQFWENRSHDDEPKTDYSGLNPCFLEDEKKH